MEIEGSASAEFSELSSRTAVVGRHTQLAELLGAMIVHGELPSGSQIVPEELGQRYGVSRSVVREALRSLEAKGLVAARPKLGTHVQPDKEWETLHSDVIRWRVQGPHGVEQFTELMDLRTGLEPIAARRCAERSDPALAATLREACNRMRQAVEAGDAAAFTAADISFHTAVWRGAGSLTFTRLSEVVAAALAARAALDMLPDHVDLAAVESHLRIAGFIADGDGSQAERATRELVKIAAREVGAFVDARRDDASGPTESAARRDASA